MHNQYKLRINKFQEICLPTAFDVPGSLQSKNENAWCSRFRLTIDLFELINFVATYWKVNCPFRIRSYCEQNVSGKFQRWNKNRTCSSWETKLKIIRLVTRFEVKGKSERHQTTNLITIYAIRNYWRNNNNDSNNNKHWKSKMIHDNELRLEINLA